MKSQEIFERWEQDSESRDFMLTRLRAAINDKKISEEKAEVILSQLIQDEIKSLRWFMAKMISQMNDMEGEIESLKFQLRHNVEPGVAVAFNANKDEHDRLPD